MRARIKATGTSRVTISGAPYRLNLDGEFSVHAPHTGGYVRFDDGSQVCEGLSRRGNTLEWDPRFGPFIELIRREHRKALRSFNS